MKRLALLGLLVGASLASAAMIGQRIETRPYGYLNVPTEATTAATGGLGVVATDQVKSTVVVQYTGGAPCGPMPGLDETPWSGRSGARAGGMNLWLPVGIGVAAVAGLAVVGFVLLRRSRV